MKSYILIEGLINKQSRLQLLIIQALVRQVISVKTTNTKDQTV